jgi:hypothetical protein
MSLPQLSPEDVQRIVNEFNRSRDGVLAAEAVVERLESALVWATMFDKSAHPAAALVERALEIARAELDLRKRVWQPPAVTIDAQVAGFTRKDD